MRRVLSSTLASVMLALAALPWTLQAQAHARLVTAEPAANSTVAAPKMIHLQFSTELAKKFSTFKLTDTDGNAVTLMLMDNQDPRMLMAAPTGALGPGIYTVSWIAVSTDDGHKTSGSYSFTVQ
jgi:methionine-rich copper-binding protein CopC